MNKTQNLSIDATVETTSAVDLITNSKVPKTSQPLNGYEASVSLSLPEFENIKVSTKTIIAKTNLEFNIQELNAFLPITEYIVVPKKRGRKKKNPLPDPNRFLEDGSIVTINPGGGNMVRGVCLKKPKKKGKTDSFRNSTTIVMYCGGKMINFKVSRNGMFQMTGVKLDWQAENCIKFIWGYIKDQRHIYTKPKGEPFMATFAPAMRNIDFSLGFLLDREKLDTFFNMETDYYSLLETSISYTGVNIKIPVTMPITDLMLNRLVYETDTPDSDNDSDSDSDTDSDDEVKKPPRKIVGEWKKIFKVPYQAYLDMLPLKEQQKKIDKQRLNSFLVFHSGKVIMSSMCAEFARDSYYEFIGIIAANKELFQEQLDVDSD